MDICALEDLYIMQAATLYGYYPRINELTAVSIGGTSSYRQFPPRSLYNQSTKQIFLFQIGRLKEGAPSAANLPRDAKVHLERENQTMTVHDIPFSDHTEIQRRRYGGSVKDLHTIISCKDVKFWGLPLGKCVHCQC